MIAGKPKQSDAMARLTSAVIALAALPFFAVLGFAISRVHRDLGIDQVLVYYVAPACVGLALIATLRATATVRMNVALLIVAIGVATLSAEMGVTLVLRAQARRAPGDTSSMAELMRTYRAAGYRTYPTVPGNVLVDEDATLRVEDRLVHPITPVPGGVTAVLCNEGPGGVIYESDRFGFNNPDESWDQDDLELALLGDSYTQGVCVEDRGQLGTLLRAQFRTLNLGVRGAGPIQSLAILREYASTRRPEAVVWIYYEGNDLYDVGRESVRSWLLAYLDGSYSEGLSEIAGEFDDAYAAWIDSLLTANPFESRVQTSFRSVLPSVLKLSSLRSIAGFGVGFPTRGSVIGVIPEVFVRANRDVQAWGGQMYLVYLPAYERYRTRVGEGMRGRREILEAAESAGIPVIDLDPAFRRTGDPKRLWTSSVGHLSEEGYRLVAGEIAARLRAEPPD